MVEPTQEIFTQSKIVVCEGVSDCRFLTVLLERRGINGFQLVQPAKSKDGFENRLRTFRIDHDEFTKLRTILLVSDNDDDPRSSFENIMKQVRRAKNYPVPIKPLEIAKAKNEPHIVIVMLPWSDIPGGMETLVLESISAKELKIRECLNAYLACTLASSWSANKQSKMLLGCMIAAICEGNPVGSLSYLWNRENNLSELLDHQCFNRLVDFLSSLNE